MNADPYTIAIVVDPNFGARLRELPPHMPVWIAATPASRAAAEAVWNERTGHTHIDGITTFSVTDGERPSESCERILGDVDLHHGEFSHTPAYAEVRVIGAVLDEVLEAAFREYDFTVFERNAEGFIARRGCFRRPHISHDV